MFVACLGLILAAPSGAQAKLPSIARARLLTLRALRNDVTLNVPGVTGEPAFTFPAGMVPSVSSCTRARTTVACTGAAYFADPGRGLNYGGAPGWYRCTDRFIFTSSSRRYILKPRGCSNTQASKWFTIARAIRLATQYGTWLVSDVGGSALRDVACDPIFVGDGVYEHGCSYTFDFPTSSFDQQVYGLGPTAACTQSIVFQLRNAYPINGFEILVETGNGCSNLAGGQVYEGPAPAVFKLERRGGPIYDPDVPVN